MIHMLSPEEEMIHNEVVVAFSATFGPEYDVRLNVGDDRKCDVQGHYPDIVAANQQTGELRIAEVKTPTLTSAKQAETQWRPFSRIADHFTLVVARESLARALRFSRGLHVDALVCYERTSNGTVAFCGAEQLSPP